MEKLMSQRIQILKDKMLSAPRYASIEQARIITRVYQENEHLSIPEKRALSLKAAMEELEIGWNKNDDISQLTNKTLEALSLLPKNIQGKDTGAEAIKAVLGNLRAIPSKLAELRNVYGSGHGKSASFKGLEERHAKLAVGSSITFVDFIWSTYEKQKETSC